MAFVQEHDGVLGQVVGQRARRLARRRARQVPGVVLDAFAMADFAEHFQVKPGALLNALRLDQLALGDEELDALFQLHLDGFHRRQHTVARRHVMAAGIDREARNLLLYAPGQRVQQLQGIHLVVEQLNTYRQLAVLGRKHVDGLAAHTERAPAEVHVVALVLHADQLRDHIALPQLVAHAQRHDHLVVTLGLANAVDRRHRGHDQHIAPLQNALGARQPHLLDVLVDRRVLLDEQVALRHIGLRLVIVVVADEVFDRVVREELAKLAVQLRRQRLVGRKDYRRTPQPRNHVGHREGLARAGHPQQRLEHLAIAHALSQLLDRLRLVAGRRIRHEQLERRIGKAHEFTGAVGIQRGLVVVRQSAGQRDDLCACCGSGIRQP